MCGAVWRPRGAGDQMLTLALSKGIMLGPTLERLKRAGYASADLSSDSRRLVFRCSDGETTLLIVRPSDVPTYVEYGAADAGVVGKDVLMEQDRDVYEPANLGSQDIEARDVGVRKALVQARRLRRIRPRTRRPTDSRSRCSSRTRFRWPASLRPR